MLLATWQPRRLSRCPLWQYGTRDSISGLKTRTQWSGRMLGRKDSRNRRRMLVARPVMGSQRSSKAWTPSSHRVTLSSQALGPYNVLWKLTPGGVYAPAYHQLRQWDLTLSMQRRCSPLLISRSAAVVLKTVVFYHSWLVGCSEKHEAQLSQRDRGTLCVIEHFAKSLKVNRNSTLK